MSVPSKAQEQELPVRRDMWPARVEYDCHGTPWVCNHFDELAGEFETVTPELLPRFHQAASLNERRWRYVRRIFGLRPVIPPADISEDDLRDWTREELCKADGVTRSQLKQELDAVRGVWVAFLKTSAPAAVEPEPEKPKATPTYELNLADDPLLKEFNFRVKFADATERDWFVAKVRDFETVLREKMVSGLAHSACLTALRLHRLSYRLDTYEEKHIGGKEWKADYELTNKITDEYNRQLKQILDLCPAASHLAGKMAFQPMISTITQALMEAVTDPQQRLIDGLFTALEIQVLHRISVQAPDPQYRLGWVVGMNASRAGLFDPNWKCPYPEKFMACVTKAYNATFVAASQEAGLPVPDLLADGEKGEYAPIVPPPAQTP